MINWKTTLAGLIGLIAYVVASFGVEVSQEVQNAIVVVTVFIVGLFARDASTDDLKDV